MSTAQSHHSDHHAFHPVHYINPVPQPAEKRGEEEVNSIPALFQEMCLFVIYRRFPVPGNHRLPKQKGEEEEGEREGGSRNHTETRAVRYDALKLLLIAGMKNRSYQRLFYLMSLCTCVWQTYSVCGCVCVEFRLLKVIYSQ
jgi:hypothetical protein